MNTTMTDVLEALGITIDATYVPHKTPSGESPVLRWRISVRRNGRQFHETDYSAGCAHSPEYNRNGGRVTVAVVQECDTGWRADRPGWYGTPVPPPDVADVMRSLLLDASSTDENFNDWCANYGFDTDSRKAEASFNQCRETAAALRRTFDRDEMASLEDAFSDY